MLHQPRRVETVDAAELGEVRGERAQIVLRRHQRLEPEQLLSADRRAYQRRVVPAMRLWGGPGPFDDDNRRCSARELSDSDLAERLPLNSGPLAVERL